MNKKGISTVVATILIILISVIAVVIIWAVLKPMLERTAGEISTNCLEVDLGVASATCNNTSHKADVSVKLNSGKIAGVKLIFGSSTESQVVDRADAPGELETKAYSDITLTINNVDSVNVGAIIKTPSGENKTCAPTGTAKSC